MALTLIVLVDRKTHLSARGASWSPLWMLKYKRLHSTSSYRCYVLLLCKRVCSQRHGTIFLQWYCEAWTCVLAQMSWEYDTTWMMGMSNLTKTPNNTPQSHESRRHILSFAADALTSVRKKSQLTEFAIETALTLDGPFSPKGGRRSFCKR